MPEQHIEYGGKVHQFPDTFTDQDIQFALQEWDRNPDDRPPAGIPLDTTMKMSAVGAIPSVAEGMGIDPQRPIIGTAKNIINSVRGTAEALTKPSMLPQMAKDTASSLVEGPKNLYQGYQKGDYNQMGLGAGQTAIRDVPAVYGAAKAIRGGISSLPSTKSAGAKMNTLHAALDHIPVDTTAGGTVLARAKQLRATGSTMPKVMRNFEQNRAASTANFGGTPVTQAMDFRTSSDFATNAGALSTKEASAVNRPMQGQVKQFAKAMRESNRNAAVSAGMGDLYDQAMKEYRGAMNAEHAKEVMKKWAVRAALTAAGGGIAGAGYEAGKALSGNR